jgi:hypothetical protein
MKIGGPILRSEWNGEKEKKDNFYCLNAYGN